MTHADATSMIPGTLDSGTDRRQAHGPARQCQRQGPDLLPEEGLGRGGLRRVVGHRHRVARGAHRPDQGRRQHAVVLRHRVRHGDRLARHGLDRDPGHEAERRGRLQPVGRARDPVQRRQDQGCRRGDGEAPLPDGNVLGGIESSTSTNFGDAASPMFDADGPKCWMLNQGSFITGFFPEETIAALDDEVGVFGFPPGYAGGENPVEGGGDLLTLLNDSDQRQEGRGLHVGDRHRQRRSSLELVLLAAQGLRRQPLPEPGDEGRGGLRLLRVVVPVRRVGRHAGRGRHGLLLEGDDRLDQRRRGPRRRAGQHRGQLAVAASRGVAI